MILDILAGLQGVGIAGHVSAQLSTRRLFNLATADVTDIGEFGEGAPSAILDPKFKPSPIFKVPVREWR